MNTDKLVIKVENGQPVNYPLTYDNFLLLFPECPVQEIPTNEVISPYGYELFTLTPRPEYDWGVYIKPDGDDIWTNTWVQTN